MNYHTATVASWRLSKNFVLSFGALQVTRKSLQLQPFSINVFNRKESVPTSSWSNMGIYWVAPKAHNLKVKSPDMRATWSHLSCVELHIFHSQRFRVINGLFVAIQCRVLFHTLLLSLFPRIQGLSVFNWKFDDRTSIFCENFWVVVLKKSFQICSIIFVLMILPVHFFQTLIFRKVNHFLTKKYFSFTVDWTRVAPMKFPF